MCCLFLESLCVVSGSRGTGGRQVPVGRETRPKVSVSAAQMETCPGTARSRRGPRGRRDRCDHGTSRDQELTFPEEWRRCPASPDSWRARRVKDQTRSSSLLPPPDASASALPSAHPLIIYHLVMSMHHCLPPPSVSPPSTYLRIHSSICLSTHHPSPILHLRAVCLSVFTTHCVYIIYAPIALLKLELTIADLRSCEEAGVIDCKMLPPLWKIVFL